MQAHPSRSISPVNRLAAAGPLQPHQMSPTGGRRKGGYGPIGSAVNSANSSAKPATGHEASLPSRGPSRTASSRTPLSASGTTGGGGAAHSSPTLGMRLSAGTLAATPSAPWTSQRASTPGDSRWRGASPDFGAQGDPQPPANPGSAAASGVHVSGQSPTVHIPRALTPPRRWRPSSHLSQSSTSNSVTLSAQQPSVSASISHSGLPGYEGGLSQIPVQQRSVSPFNVVNAAGGSASLRNSGRILSASSSAQNLHAPQRLTSHYAGDSLAAISYVSHLASSGSVSLPAHSASSSISAPPQRCLGSMSAPTHPALVATAAMQAPMRLPDVGSPASSATYCQEGSYAMTGSPPKTPASMPMSPALMTAITQTANGSTPAHEKSQIRRGPVATF